MWSGTWFLSSLTKSLCDFCATVLRFELHTYYRRRGVGIFRVLMYVHAPTRGLIDIQTTEVMSTGHAGCMEIFLFSA